MNSIFYELSQTLDGLQTREELLSAISLLEDHYDAFSDPDQEIADRLLIALSERLALLESDP